MKKIYLTIILSLFLSFELSAARLIIVHSNGQVHGHHEILHPADQPEVYYDDVEQEIIIDGQWSEASYYDVDIVSLSTLDTALSTRVSSTYDTIDVSSLPDDNYQIVITSSNNNEYVGYFTNY